jgi:hypothetical protein
MQSVHIPTNIVSSNPVHGELHSIEHYVIKFVSDLGRIFPGTAVSFTNKADREYITEILFKVALNTLTLSLSLLYEQHHNICSVSKYVQYIG